MEPPLPAPPDDEPGDLQLAAAKRRRGQPGIPDQEHERRRAADQMRGKPAVDDGTANEGNPTVSAGVLSPGRTVKGHDHGGPGGTAGAEYLYRKPCGSGQERPISGTVHPAARPVHGEAHHPPG